MDIVTALLGGVTDFLIAHPAIAYGVLFAGSYVETVFGVSFFIPGELFFIPGALLAGAGTLNIWLVALACFAGGILGDSTSYWMGRAAGARFVALFEREGRIFNRRNYELGKAFFLNHGPNAVFLARVAGPFSWVTPFLAGTYRVPYRTFLFYNVPGVLVGIGQFLVIGYFFASNYQRILEFAQQSMLMVVVLVAVLAGGWFLLKKIYMTR